MKTLLDVLDDRAESLFVAAILESDEAKHKQFTAASFRAFIAAVRARSEPVTLDAEGT